MKLEAKQPLSRLIQERGIHTLDELFSYIRKIPYGRTSDRADLSKVITENKGTCSSKHALVKAIAVENQLDKIELILCLYKMTEENTPGIGQELSQNGLAFLPEAHCYLQVNDQKVDLTNEHSDLSRIKQDILEERAIHPAQVGAYKVDYHKDYLKNWLRKNQLQLSFETIWRIREACIENLAAV